MAAGLDAGGDWAVRFERHEGVKCNAIVLGGCDPRAEGVDGSIRLEAGDCFILPHGRPFLISSHGARLGESAEAIYRPVPHGGTATYNEGGAFF